MEKSDADLQNVEEEEKSEEKIEIDPYAYLESGDFSSEIYKIELSNLPRKFGISQLKKKLLHLKLKPCKVKSIENGHFAYVTFRNEEDKEEAIKVLQGYVWKNKPVRVKEAAANADPFLLKRKLVVENEEADVTKRAKLDETENFVEKLNDVVTPLWRLSYEDQLKNKTDKITEHLKKLTREICRNNEDLFFVLAEKKMKNAGLCFSFHPLKASPKTKEYRNKCEFTIGVGADGKDGAIGFRMGSYKDGDLSVVPADNCINIPPAMKAVLRELREYLDSRSEVASFNSCSRKGLWKHALIRTSSDESQVLLNVVCHPQQMTEEELEKEKDLLKNHYERLIDSKSTVVTSLYFQFESDRRERYEEGTPIHLLGEKFIVEDLLNLKFQISPLSFFQVNTPATEVLYSVVADMCKVNPNVVVVDACCGTGTIGLTMARKVKKVIGIEINSQAIADAKINAELNGVDNVEFVCGKVEDVLPDIVKRLDESEEVVVVVDPPRAGLHADVIKVIRRTTFLTRLVYVSCKLNAALQNIVDLTRQASRRVVGKPFQLVDVTAVDLFPQTELYETVLLLERQT